MRIGAPVLATVPAVVGEALTGSRLEGALATLALALAVYVTELARERIRVRREREREP